MKKTIAHDVFSQAEQIAQEAVKRSVMGLIWRKAEEWMGSAYTEQQARYLTQMSRFYQRAGLGEDRPPMFVLNQEKRPEYVLNPERWSSFVFSIANQQPARPLSRFGGHLALQCAGYLDSCQEQWIKDKQGNPLQQFFSEFMFFGLAVLSTMSPSEAIQTIGARLSYLDLMEDESLLFEASWKAWRMSKRDVLQRLRRILKAAKDYAVEESTKSCVRDEIRCIRDSFHGLLETVCQILYSVRANKAIQNIPMVDIVRFCNGLLSSDVPTYFDQLDSEIRDTPTGRLLWELIYLSGPLAFGHPTQYKIKKPQPLLFFDESLQAKPIQWNYFSEKLDLPGWVGTVLEKQQYIEQLRDRVKVALRLARLSGLLEKAYELSGHLGSQWAYGNPVGAASLELLLQLLAFDITALQQQLCQQLDKDEHRRAVYDRIHRKKQHAGSNINFIRVKKHVQHFDRLAQFTLQSIQHIKTQRDLFPADQGDIAALRRRFYTELSALAQQYYTELPEALVQQQQLKKLIHDEQNRQRVMTSQQDGVQVVSFSVENTSAKQFVKEGRESRGQQQWQQCIQRYQQEALEPFNEIRIKKRGYHVSWSLTAQTHGLLHGENFSHYYQALQQIGQLLTAPRSEENLRSLLGLYRQASEERLQLQIQVQQLRVKMGWRLSLLPFRCWLGWPFNRKNQRVLTSLDQQLQFSRLALRQVLKADMCLPEHQCYYVGRIDAHLEQQLFQNNSMPEVLRGSLIERPARFCISSAMRRAQAPTVMKAESSSVSLVELSCLSEFKKAIRHKQFQKARVLLDKVNQQANNLTLRETVKSHVAQNNLDGISEYLQQYLLTNLLLIEKPSRHDEYASVEEVNALIRVFAGAYYSPQWNAGLSLLMKHPEEVQNLLITIQQYLEFDVNPFDAQYSDFERLIFKSSHPYLSRIFKLLTLQQQKNLIHFLSKSLFKVFELAT